MMGHRLAHRKNLSMGNLNSMRTVGAIALLTLINSTILLTFPSLKSHADEMSAAIPPTHPLTHPLTKQNPTFIRTPAECPTTIEPLTELLLRDVADYGNRVSQRSRRSTRDFMPQSHIITAGAARIDSLDPRIPGIIPTEEEIRANGLESIFFTTLERQYLDGEAEALQHYHWAFLAQTSEGWALSFMYSILGDYPSDPDPPTPPYNSSHGVIAQAIKLWLRDCHAGSVAAPGSE